MTQYTWKMDENERIHLYDPEGVRLATIDNDGDRTIGELDAEDIVAHLNTPLICTGPAEYKAIQLGFGLLADIDVTEDIHMDQMRIPVEILTPHGTPIGSLTDHAEAMNVIKHLMRKSTMPPATGPS
jgi:hypothetical protein